MKFKEGLKNNKIILATIIAYTIVLTFKTDIFFQSLKTLKIYLKQMIEILPAVILISGLIDVWVPRETIIKNFGSEAGIKGKIASISIGSFSAGPIYAAFPITKSLLKKGASIVNIVIILSAWAVIKAPMLIVETKFLGIEFMFSRYILTVPGIIIIGIATGTIIKKKDILSREGPASFEEKILEALPGYNCGSCGFDNCPDYAESIVKKDADLGKCVPGGKEVEDKIKKLVETKN